MPYGEGGLWEGEDPVAGSDGVTIEADVASDPDIRVIRVLIEPGDSLATIAKRAADEWNEKHGLSGIVAVACDDPPLTVFFLTGALADGTHTLTLRAATFDGKPREVLAPTVVSKQNRHPSDPNLSLRLTRVGVRFEITDLYKLDMVKSRSLPREQVIGPKDRKPVATPEDEPARR